VTTKGELDLYINALPDAERVPIKSMVYRMNDFWRLGDSPQAENAAWYKVSSTTAASAGTEFVVAHGMGFAPHLLVPVLDLTKINAQLVPLTVSRAPDATNVYLKSSSTSTVFTMYLE